MADTNVIAYMAFDPGKTTGVAWWDAVPNLMFFNTYNFDELRDKLEEQDLTYCETFIIESFLLFPKKRDKLMYDNMLTSQVIGSLKTIARQQGIRVVEQSPSFKVTGYKWWGKKPLAKSNSLNHAYDAVAHGTYYLVKNSLMAPPVLDKE